MVITVNPIGGLANRMRAIASCVALANDIGAQLKIIWGINWELHARFEDLFVSRYLNDVCTEIIYPSKNAYRGIYNTPSLPNLYLSHIIQSIKYDWCLRDNEEVMDSYIHNDIVLRSRAQQSHNIFIQTGQTIYPFTRELFLRLFKPADEINQISRLWTNQFGKHVVGVHIRRTDNERSINTSSDEKFIRAMETHLDIEPSSTFFMASDDQYVKALMKQHFGDKVIFNTNCADRNSLYGMKDATAELFTLAKTTKILGSYYSSFSDVAALLGNIPIEIIR